MKLKLIIVGLIYFVYAVIHLIIFNNVKTLSSYSGITHEAQYLINYTFVILNLFMFIFVFRKKDENKMIKGVYIASLIYIVTIYISILTNTSSFTYIEKMGYKGWFESGNSLGAILTISLFIILPYINTLKYKKLVLAYIILVGIFLTMLLGSRVGMYGFILIIVLHIVIGNLINFIKNKKVNKKVLAIGLVGILALGIAIICIGSNTLDRRKHLQDIEENIVDNEANDVSHISGDLLKIKEKIEKNELEEGYMNEPEKQSILYLYNIANKYNITNNDMRMQQLIYNVMLVKNQKNVGMFLFGNGYMANFRELVLEMELPAFLLNFGLIGFILYFMPFALIFIYSTYIGIKNIKKVDDKYIMLVLGCGYSYMLSLLSGYTFFSQSTSIMIIVVHVILLKKALELKKL